MERNWNPLVESASRLCPAGLRCKGLPTDGGRPSTTRQAPSSLVLLMKRKTAMLTFKTGDLFAEDCEAFVNTVNCVGVMGCGIALQFKKTYPVP